VRKGAYLRAYAYDFIERFAQGFTRADIERALHPVVAE
jgi:LysR family cys regulon transcriptional activator